MYFWNYLPTNAARDIYHAAVIKALIADGWTITNDPLYRTHI
ncbi:hypothetical protein GNF10_06025 [Nostoc sp. UCD121]|nr:hypothetical protein [Nostoc sp. UCD120]MBC1275554.1 hypothetical protein [Nostoc sp. UCD121]MBC1297130.1 hypothetical protein [Nostoc sp. UCD122]